LRIRVKTEDEAEDVEEKATGDEQGGERSIDESSIRIEELEKKNEEYLDRLKHLQADFENYKKRMEKERREIITLSTERLVKQLLVLLDDFERALTNSNNCKVPENQKQGMKMVQNQLKEILGGENISEIDTSEKLDPFQHEVVTRVQNSKYEDNEIIECLQKGYKMGDKVIRPARVVICRKEEQASDRNEKEEENKYPRYETKKITEKEKEVDLKCQES